MIMSLLSDCASAKKGEEAAIRRLDSHIVFLLSKSDLNGLLFLKSKNMPVLDVKIKKAIGQIQSNSDRQKKEGVAKKQKFADLVKRAEQLLSNAESSIQAQAVPLLKELTALRWKITPDQAFYNNDAVFLRLVKKANQAGFKI